MASRRFVVVILVMVMATSVNALTYEGEPEYSAGNGANSAMIVIDFDFDNSFTFEFSWDGEASGWDALTAIAGAGAMEFETAFGGTFVTDFSYPGGEKFDYGTINAGWAYFTSSNGEEWSYSLIGVADRVLSNNCWDSWVWSSYSGGEYGWDNADRAPGQMPIPEPVTVALLGFGGLFIRRHREFR